VKSENEGIVDASNIKNTDANLKTLKIIKENFSK